jgi:anti-sigma regulatory factor (Ser/Thr protein kinase)
MENDPALIDRLVNVLQKELAVVGFGDDRTRTRVGAALSEALSNALYHGNLEVSSDLRQDDEREFYRLAARRRFESPYRDRRIEVHARLDRHEARYIVRDEGPGFDISIVDRPIDPEDLMRIGGRGITIIRAYMDDVIFKAPGNQITMVKRHMHSAEEGSRSAFE